MVNYITTRIGNIFQVKNLKNLIFISVIVIIRDILYIFFINTRNILNKE